MLGVLVLSVLSKPQWLQTTPRSTGTQAAELVLPTGVCKYTPEPKLVSDSSRLEVKLVTNQSLRSSDPDFPWPGRLPPALLPYYWMVAASGSYTWQTDSLSHEPSTFLQLLLYVDASDCRGIGVKANGVNARDHGWPAWFDQMAAVVHIKIQ
jgi:hypothetical protein